MSGCRAGKPAGPRNKLGSEGGVHFGALLFCDGREEGWRRTCQCRLSPFGSESVIEARSPEVFVGHGMPVAFIFAESHPDTAAGHG